MDALSSGGDFRGSAAAVFSVMLVFGIGGLAPFAYMTTPIDRPVDLGPEPSSELLWFDAAPMTYPRSSPQVVVLPEGDVLVTGGISANGITSTTEVYDPESDSWRMGPSMSVGRVGHTATLLADGTVLVTGGETSSGTTATAEVIDLGKGASLAVSDMAFARSGHAAASLPDGRVLVTGGTDWMNGPWNQAEAYVPSSHSFVPAGSMSQERFFFTLQALPDGAVLAVGGDSEGTSEEYDPDTNSWGSVAYMESKRYSASSIVLGDGDVLCAGGVEGDEVLSAAEVYSSIDGAWTAIDGMASPRANFGLALLPSGKAIATGSWSRLGASDSCESVCPCSMSWADEADMRQERGLHGTATTSNGTVLAIGGWDGTRALSSVEMFVEVWEEPTPEPGLCEPMDLLPLVRAVSDELRGHSENGLVAKLFVAQAAYDLGSMRLCLDVLDAFYRQVRAFHHSGHLGDDGTSLLYDGYAEVVECLGGEPLPPLT